MFKFLVLSALAAPTVDPTYHAVVTKAPSPQAGWLEVTTTDPYEGDLCLTLSEDPPPVIRWHLDPEVKLSRRDLTAGTRIRYTGPSLYTARTIDVVCLGPLAMAVSVEEFVVEASGGDLSAGLSATEREVERALGSPSWLVRHSVTRTLREQGARAWRSLVWLRHARDPEVRYRAEAMLGALGWGG